jgi:hypothetical protein
VKELIQRFAAKVFFEVFDRHRVNLAFREFHRNIRAIRSAETIDLFRKFAGTGPLPSR